MELKEAIYGRRSIRKYQPQAIPEEDVREIVEAGTMAPSGTNRQQWYFIAIADPEEMEVLRTIAREGADRFRPMLEKRFALYPEVVKETTTFIGSLGDCPLAVLAFLRDPEVAEEEKSTAIQSVAAAIQNMCLAAYEKGIGSCWLTSLCKGPSGVAIKEHFAPKKGEFVALVTFGYPAQEPKMPKRKEGRTEFRL